MNFAALLFQCSVFEVIALLFQITLDSLNENYVNVTSHVISMENEWPKYKQTNLNLVAENVKINGQLDTLRNDSKTVVNLVHDLEERLKLKQDQPVPMAGLKEDAAPAQVNS